jgi:drug/metabolite transporter (DMT)-like permease
MIHAGNLIARIVRSNEIAIARARHRRLTQRVFAKKSNGAIVISLVLAVFLWGGSNAGTKFVVKFWGPAWLGSSRLLCGGMILLAILKWTHWLGALTPLTPSAKRELWLRGGLSLACYIVIFNWALHYTAASHVALYLGMSPIWTLLWDERPEMTWRSAQRYGAAGLALSGVVVLFWPSLMNGNSKSGSPLVGEVLGFAASWLWANYGRQCRALGARLSGAEVSAHTMWRAGVLLLPLAIVEIARFGLIWRTDVVLVHCYCFIAGGVIAYALWNNALRHWTTSRVFLFNNLVPLSTMAWARVCLGEPVTRTFWLAMLLVVAGVVVGQARWAKVLGPRWSPLE